MPSGHRPETIADYIEWASTTLKVDFSASATRNRYETNVQNAQNTVQNSRFIRDFPAFVAEQEEEYHRRTGAQLLLSGELTVVPDWNKRLVETMPLLGHRNWVLIVDSAYPLQTSPGVETIETHAAQLDVVRTVLREIENSIQVRPVVYMDAELPFISDSDAPGVSAYRSEIGELLHKSPAQSRRHEALISDIAEAGKTFHVLVLKTNMTIPYTSLFIRLDCKYWSADQEKKLRLKMGDVPPK